MEAIKAELERKKKEREAAAGGAGGNGAVPSQTTGKRRSL